MQPDPNAATRPYREYAVDNRRAGGLGLETHSRREPPWVSKASAVGIGVGLLEVATTPAGLEARLDVGHLGADKLGG